MLAAIGTLAFVLWLIIPSKKERIKKTFQKMADEYSQEGVFIDEYNQLQTDPDLLIDKWKSISRKIDL